MGSWRFSRLGSHGGVLNTTEHMSLSALEQHLAAAADMLRGKIDQADFKAYIFPLLFFKRISDVYLEEYAQSLEESGGDHDFATFAENHRFQISDGCLWSDVREVTQNVGQALVRAMRGIEAANPDTLYGIFGDADWTDKTKLPDPVLLDLLEHFSAKNMSNATVEPDVFGQAYEYLIKRFADQSNKKAGEYYTPRSVVKLMVDILDPREGETVYDPACGTGGMLVEVVEHVKRAAGRPQMLYGKLFGQEKNVTTSAIARMNLILHGVEDFRIVRADTLRDPAFFSGDRLAQFDCVIANPPFSLKKWGHESWSSDPYGRSLTGVPPVKYGDWAWVQHMVASMARTTGRTAVVLPQGALFRGDAEGKIRSKMLESDRIEAVVGLGANLFYGTTLAACILVLRDAKRPDRSGQVLFVDASHLLRRGRNQNTLEPEHVEAIEAAVSRFADEPDLSHVATLAEIRSNDGNLNISLYVRPSNRCEGVTLVESLAVLRSAHDETLAAESELRAHMTGWGLL